MIALAAVAVLAASPIDGVWAPDAAICRHGQELEDAPTIIRKGRMMQHEAECRLGRLSPEGPGRWTAKGACTVEGDRQPPGLFRFRLSGDVLRIREPDALAERVMRRCPEPRHNPHRR